jgi:hypothetical protein
MGECYFFASECARVNQEKFARDARETLYGTFTRGIPII